jgi:hypothetical protein
MRSYTRQLAHRRRTLGRVAPTRPLSASEVDEAMLLVLREANVRPEILYAYQKTGRLVTEENARLISAEDLAEWDAAVDEYRRNSKP